MSASRRRSRSGRAPGAYDALYEHREDESEVDRRLAYWLQSFRERNQPTIARMTSMFKIASRAPRRAAAGRAIESNEKLAEAAARRETPAT